MINVKQSHGGHEWEKQNLMTITTKKGSYDILKCKKCGIQGRTTSLSTISLKGSYSMEKINNCDGSFRPPKRIRITKCGAVGEIFENLQPKTEHDVIDPPLGYKNDQTGVWVMGVGGKVKVLKDEYEPVQ